MTDSRAAGWIVVIGIFLLSACGSGTPTSSVGTTSSPSLSASPTIDLAVKQCQTDVNILVGIAVDEGVAMVAFVNSKAQVSDAQKLIASTQKQLQKTKAYKSGS